MFAAVSLGLGLVKKLWPVILFGVLFAATMTYRKLYHSSAAKLVAIQQEYNAEVVAAKTCSDATVALAAQLSVKNTKLQAAELHAAALVTASTQRSKTLVATIDKGKS